MANGNRGAGVTEGLWPMGAGGEGLTEGLRPMGRGRGQGGVVNGKWGRGKCEGAGQRRV